MKEWLPRRNEYISETIGREAPPPNRACQICDKADSLWRCRDCFGEPSFCTICCRDQHILHPFHRVKAWNGKHYMDSWLWHTGTDIHVGHRGNKCPTRIRHVDDAINMPTASDDPFTEDPFGGLDDPFAVPQVYWSDELQSDRPIGTFHRGGKVVIIIHTNGVHHLPVHFCECEGKSSEEIQLLQMGLFPSTYKDVRTVFTMQLLDDYLLQNLECKTSTTHYYSKLRRMTSKAFPSSVPVTLPIYLT